jgi:hypothetical protein
VFIKPAQFNFNGIEAMVVRLDTCVGQNGLQLSQCCPNLVTAVIHAVRASAPRQMLIHEAANGQVKTLEVEPAPT